MLHDVRKRPFSTAGFTGFVLMLPLAVTSTAGWIRRLGGKRWQMLHRLIYPGALAGCVSSGLKREPISSVQREPGFESLIGGDAVKTLYQFLYLHFRLGILLLRLEMTIRRDMKLANVFPTTRGQARFG